MHHGVRSAGRVRSWADPGHEAGRQAGAKREAIAGIVRKKDGAKPSLRAVDGVLAKKGQQPL